VARANVIANRSALAQHEIPVGDHRSDPHRMQRLVLVGCETVVGSTVVTLELVIEFELLAEPDDAFGLRDPQMVNGQHCDESLSLMVGRAPNITLDSRAPTVSLRRRTGRPCFRQASPDCPIPQSASAPPPS